MRNCCALTTTWTTLSIRPPTTLKGPLPIVEGLMQVLLRKLPAETLEMAGVKQITRMMHESWSALKKQLKVLPIW